MPVIQPKIIVPESIYKDFVLGNVEIKGLAKNIDNGRVVKHLDTLETDDDSNAGQVALAIGAIVAVTAIVAGVTVRLISKAKQKKVEKFKTCLNTYITAANEQTLTAEIIDNLIAAMDSLKHSTRKKVVVEFSTEELTALVECLCNHTQTIAQANNIEFVRDYTNEEKSDVLLRLRKNLIIQKEMLCDAA